MNLNAKIIASQKLIRAQLMRGLQATIMWSSGKDSMVLLHLIRSLGARLPVILHRQRNAPHKYHFAETIIREWQLEAHDYAPRAVGMQHGNGLSETVAYYQIGSAPQSHIAIPLNLYEDADPECGFEVLQQTPCAPFAYPHELIFHGHKSSDCDPLMGHVPLNRDVVEMLDVPVTVFPLREWTDADIWEYSRQFAVPQQPDRYRPDGTEDKRHPNNPDYFNRCVRCLKPSEPDALCPKTNTLIASRAAHVNQFPVPRPTYINH